MKINFTKAFISDLDKQVLYISGDKPIAAKKFKRFNSKFKKRLAKSISLQKIYLL
jgi:hypothetical protein